MNWTGFALIVPTSQPSWFCLTVWVVVCDCVGCVLLSVSWCTVVLCVPRDLFNFFTERSRATIAVRSWHRVCCVLRGTYVGPAFYCLTRVVFRFRLHSPPLFVTRRSRSSILSFVGRDAEPFFCVMLKSPTLGGPFRPAITPASRLPLAQDIICCVEALVQPRGMSFAALRHWHIHAFSPRFVLRFCSVVSFVFYFCCRNRCSADARSIEI